MVFVSPPEIIRVEAGEASLKTQVISFSFLLIFLLSFGIVYCDGRHVKRYIAYVDACARDNPKIIAKFSKSSYN